MGLDEFSPDTTIFRDEDVLRDDYQPDELIERDGQLQTYQSALKPVINGARPKNIFVYGQTGVGKTLSTRMVMDRLRADQEGYDHVDVEIVNLVCKSLNTSYQVTASLINELREDGEEITPTGYPSGMLYDMLWEELNDLDATHCLIVLDEVDSIGTDDDILYELPRCNDNGNVGETMVGVIGISNDFTFRDDLSARVKDSLCDEEIHFPPYDADQLWNILCQRAEKAFHETEVVNDDDQFFGLQSDVLTDEVLSLASAFAAQRSGSARQALKRLYKAGELARDEGSEVVTEHHVRRADTIVEKDKVRDELRSLPTQSKVTLHALYRLQDDGESPAKRARIYDEYVDTAEEAGVEPKTTRTVHDRLSQLTLKGFLEVEEKNEGPKGGSYYQYMFGIRPELVRDVLEEDDRLGVLVED